MSLGFRQRLAEQGDRTDSGDQAIKEAVKKGQLVLIEPDVNVRDALTLLLQEKGWSIRLADGRADLLAAIEQDGLTAVISESTLPDCVAQDILDLCAKRGIPVIFTGHDLPLQGAVDLIRQGAMDFLDKPFPQSRLVDLLERLSNRQNG